MIEATPWGQEADAWTTPPGQCRSGRHVSRRRPCLGPIWRPRLVTATLMTLSLLGICFFFTVLVNDLIDHR